MEQTKNEPTKENKAAPETGKPKKEREPLTEAQRLKRQKMIVLPAMVLVFIGAMWLIFAPSSGKEQPPGTDGYNTEMPDADKANRQIIGDKLKAYEHGEMEERQESRNRAIGQLGDMFDREIAGTENGVDFDLANPGGKEERAKPATPQTIQSSAAAYRDLNATLGNFYDQPKTTMRRWTNCWSASHRWSRNWKARGARLPLWTSRWLLWRSPTSWRQSTWAVRTEDSHRRNRGQSQLPCRKGRRTRQCLSDRWSIK